MSGVLLLALSVIAFSDNLIFDVGQASNRDPRFVIHGLFLFAWFVIFVVQTSFIRTRNVTAHMRVGVAGAFIAAGVVLSTFYIFVVTYPGWDEMSFFVKANRFLMTSFALLFVLGYLNRKSPGRHKRYIYIGSLYLLEPILSRTCLESWDPYVFVPVVWNAFFVSLFAYDWITSRRIYKIRALGFAWLYVVYLVSAYV